MLVSLKFLHLIGSIGQNAGIINSGNLNSLINLIVDGTVNFTGIDIYNIDLSFLDNNGSEGVS